MRKTFGHQKWWPGDTPFEIIIGAILTQNTAWTNVEKAILNLKKARKLSFGALRRVPAKKLSALIRPSGYFNVKADRLKAFMDFLDRECRG
ncbi:MAG: endonuclease III domain-containing protein, partial [Candidatus Omnitrophica bacterium]|nr:endonuclease III domain-containing protein [Candidatus Omnitrophota bacterium]